MLGITVAQNLRRNRKITITTSASASTSVNSTSETEARIDSERSETRSTCTVRGIDFSSCGIIALILSTTLSVLAPGALKTNRTSARHGPEPRARAGVLRPVDHGRDVPQLDRRAVAVGHDHLAELGGVGQLLVDVERKLLVAAFEIARRLESALGSQGGADLREPQSLRRQRVRD